jgi:cell division protein FtsB
MNQGQLVLEVERIVGGQAGVESINRYDGELITPDEIVNHLADEE